MDACKDVRWPDRGASPRVAKTESKTVGWKLQYNFVSHLFKICQAVRLDSHAVQHDTTKPLSCQSELLTNALSLRAEIEATPSDAEGKSSPRDRSLEVTCSERNTRQTHPCCGPAS